MKLSELRKKLWPPEEQEGTTEDVAYLVGIKAREFANVKINEAQQFTRFAHERAELAESSAKAQISSLQKMYIEMLTECHQEIAELKWMLTTANAKVTGDGRLHGRRPSEPQG